MTALASPRQHLFLPWTVQEREDPVLEFDHGEGVYFFDRQGRKYLDFLSQLFNCNVGHGCRRVIAAIQKQAEKACCVSPQVLTEERSALAERLTRHTFKVFAPGWGLPLGQGGRCLVDQLFGCIGNRTAARTHRRQTGGRSGTAAAFALQRGCR